MAIEIGKGSKSERVPHNDVSLFTTTSNKSVLTRINKGIYSFLMKIKGFVLLINEIFDIMDVNKSIQRRRNDVVKIWEKFNFCDPSIVNLLFNNLDTILLFLKSSWLLLKHAQYLIGLERFLGTGNT